jgi:hypothetical protein
MEEKYILVACEKVELHLKSKKHLWQKDGWKDTLIIGNKIIKEHEAKLV